MEDHEVFMNGNSAQADSSINAPLNETKDEDVSKDKAIEINNELIKLGGIVEKGAIVFLK